MNKSLNLKSFFEPSATTISVIGALTAFAYAGITTFSSIYAKQIGMGIGAFILGIIASYTSYRSMYIFTAVIVVCSALIYYALYHRKMIKEDYYIKELSKAE
ncbi:hypothetical protein [Clostridium sp. DJ247]|uniref:hypothetical protein n=1 Tax=Clostridium sp. DJ247 TaxID=2726188 RepID=UPI0016246D19|nr:hypothetical protein [Clostridium sp. DJ247]MBC2582164.1 MFS transporter [Clostridium sp. DJ247]